MATKITPWFELFLLLLGFHLCSSLSLGADGISANESLSGDEILVSSGGKFKLGFFRPGNSSYYYIGILYNHVSVQTAVWVANRETPIFDRFSAELKISNGNLVIANGSRLPVWSTNLLYPGSSSARAVLYNDGNFALMDGPNSSQIIWQSFDHPTNTWLPGAKIGYNKLKHTTQHLSSWKNEEDAATGPFSFEMRTSSEYYMRWSRSEQSRTYEWGTLYGVFGLLPEYFRLHYIYNFSFVDNENETYVMYALHDPSIVTRFIMDVSGHFQALTWLQETWNLFFSWPRQQCQVYCLCGPFGVCSENTDEFCNCLQGFTQTSPDEWNLSDWSSGCRRTTSLDCGSNATARSQEDRFAPLAYMKLPDDPQSSAVEGMKECKMACLNDCSCTAYAYDGDTCSIWRGDLYNAQQYSQGDINAKTLYLRQADSEIPDSGKERKMGIIAGSTAAAAALLAIVLLGAWRQRKTKYATGPTNCAEGSLRAFRYQDLQAATKNFSKKLGGGGFGSVFKGNLPDSTIIAVKKLESVTQGEKQFRAEVSTIGKIQHVNLVRLRGFCSEGNMKLLVYEYMPNKSLDFHLFTKEGSKVLDWNTRYRIALGAARGFAYLHESCQDCIIHCDIKPDNILLDDEFRPRVADFGLAKLVGREFSRVLTTMRGTRGYLAPEWISGVAITAKADVYSFGMMLFEFISGRRNSEQSVDGRFHFFPTWAVEKLTEGGNLLDLLDPRLAKDADVDELARLCRVACWCVQDEEGNRPSMGQVVQILEGVRDVEMPRVPKWLQAFSDHHEDEIAFFVESFPSRLWRDLAEKSKISISDYSGNSTSRVM